MFRISGDPSLPGGPRVRSNDEPDGLTKRELFAALAMQGYCSSDPGEWPTIPVIVGDCVSLADALIAELAKEPK